MLNIDRIQVGTTTYYIMDPIARSSLSTKVDATDIYTTTQINNFLEAKANNADLGNLALLDTISYTSDLLTNKPTLGTMASKDDAASDNKQYVRKNGSWSEVSIPTLEWGQISGTLSNQTDLANALSTKANTADLGSLATKNSVDYSSNEVTNKPTLGSLASKNSVSYSTEVTDKPTLGALSSKDKVDWDTDIDDIPSTFPPSTHNHDDRYYTETEINTFLSTKANIADLGTLATKNSVSYSTEVTDKPTLGTLSSKDDVTSDNKLYGRKNGIWSEIPPSSAPTWGTISGDLSSQTDLQEALSTKADKANLGDLASKDTVSWTTDITGIPNTFPPSTHTHSYTTLTDKPTLGSLADQDTVNWETEVTNKPTLGSLAALNSISYTSNYLTNKPTLGDLASLNSIDYTSNKLTNKPTLGSLAAKDTVSWSTEITGIPSSFPPSSHTHDDRYYTESEIDTALSTKAPLASPAFTGTPTAPTATDGTNNTQIATTQFVHNAFKANDAMVWKGTIGSSGATVSSLPATHYQGWTYKVITAGTYAGQTCEIGDMIICVTDGTSASDAHWTVVQSNVDGAVTGPANATDAHVATFNGTSGKVIKDSGFTIGKSVPSDAVFTDTTYTNGAGISISGTTINNSGVRNIATGSSNGTLNVNINGTSSDIAVKGLGSAAYSATTAFATASHSHNNSTTTAAGFMSAADKQKLDGIANNANNYSLPIASSTTLGGIKIGTNLSITNGVLSATDTTYSNATTTTAGLMSSSDKSKLDGLNASNYTSSSILPNYESNSEIKTKYRVSKKDFTGGTTTAWYYPLIKFPQTNASNYASLIVSGRIGGWTNNDMSYYQALMWNRGDTGIASIDISGSATSESGYFNVVDFVIYKSDSTNEETVYAKCQGYFAFDLDLELFQTTASILYDGTKLTTTPSGTLTAQASTTQKRLALVNGKLLMNGTDIDTKYASISHTHLSIQLTNEDLNNYYDDAPTFYYAAGSNSVLNRPSEVDDAFGMVCYRTAAGYYHQILTKNGGTTYYSRSGNKTNTTWSSWTKWNLTNTDTKVTDTLSTTTKFYLAGTVATATTTGTQIFDTGIYSTTTSGQLNATTYKVNEKVTLQWNSTDQSLDFVFA